MQYLASVPTNVAASVKNAVKPASQDTRTLQSEQDFSDILKAHNVKNARQTQTQSTAENTKSKNETATDSEPSKKQPSGTQEPVSSAEKSTQQYNKQTSQSAPDYAKEQRVNSNNQSQAIEDKTPEKQDADKLVKVQKDSVKQAVDSQKPLKPQNSDADLQAHFKLKQDESELDADDFDFLNFLQSSKSSKAELNQPVRADSKLSTDKISGDKATDIILNSGTAKTSAEKGESTESGDVLSALKTQSDKQVAPKLTDAETAKTSLNNEKLTDKKATQAENNSDKFVETLDNIKQKQADQASQPDSAEKALKQDTLAKTNGEKIASDAQSKASVKSSGSVSTDSKAEVVKDISANSKSADSQAAEKGKGDNISSKNTAQLNDSKGVVVNEIHHKEQKSSKNTDDVKLEQSELKQTSIEQQKRAQKEDSSSANQKVQSQNESAVDVIESAKSAQQNQDSSNLKQGEEQSEQLTSQTNKPAKNQNAEQSRKNSEPFAEHLTTKEKQTSDNLAGSQQIDNQAVAQSDNETVNQKPDSAAKSVESNAKSENTKPSPNVSKENISKETQAESNKEVSKEAVKESVLSDVSNRQSVNQETLNQQVNQAQSKSSQESVADTKVSHAQVTQQVQKQEQVLQAEKTVDKQQSIHQQIKEQINLTKNDAPGQLNDSVRYMINSRMQSAEIRIDPPELGSMQIKVSMNGDQASVSIVVQNQQAKDVLDQSVPKLKELLEQQGIQLGESSVSEQGHQQGGETQSGKGSGQGLAGQSHDAETESNEVVVEQNITNGHVGAVDYYA